MRNLKSNPILVIGLNSFSGSQFTKYLLNKNYYVIGVSRSNLNKNCYLPFDKRNKKFKFFKLTIGKDTKKITDLIIKFKVKYIVNFASQSMVAESWKSAEDWFYTNSYSLPVLYKNINEKCKIKKIIHFSTPEVYGSNKKNLIENYNFNPSTPYAISRTTADYYIKALNENYKFPFITIRAANVYGEFQRLYRIIPKTIDYFSKGKILPLHGSGKSFRSFIHIDDVSSAIFITLKKGKIGETYHVATNQMITIKNLVKFIAKILNKDLKKSILNKKDRMGKDKFYKLNSNKIKQLGWKPKISLKMGLERVLKWYQLYQNSFYNDDYIYKHKK